MTNVISRTSGISAALAFAGCMALSGAAQAAVHWTLDSSCVNSGSASSSTPAGNTCTFSADVGTVDAIGSGWASTVNSGGSIDILLERAVIHEATTGAAGVRWVDTDAGNREGTGSPDHAMDNTNGGSSFREMELMLFDFGSESVNITDVDVAWRSGGDEAKFTVLAFTGTGPFDVFDPDTDLAGLELTHTTEELTGAGWDVVTTVSNVNADGDGFPAGAGLNDISGASAGVFSSKWIVSMHSEAFGGGAKKKGGFKIRGVKGGFDTPDPPQGVPLPSTALLLIAGALPMLRRRRA